MKYPTVFHLISDIVDKNGIVCVLIGGFALNYHKVTRQTADIDFLITKDDFEKIACALQEAGYKQDYLQKEVFVRLKSSSRYLIDLDFMFVDKETLDKLIKDAQEITIAQRKFIVPSLNHLIALKLHSIRYNPKMREHKDLPDIINLIKMNGLKVKSSEFKNLCLKYGSDELYQKILNQV